MGIQLSKTTPTRFVCVSDRVTCLSYESSTFGSPESGKNWETLLSVFRLTITDRTDASKWKEKVDQLMNGYTEPCRWSIGRSYVQATLRNSTLLLTLEHEVPDGDGQLLLIDAFMLLNPMLDGWYIGLICSGTQPLDLNLRLGLILHALAVSELTLGNPKAAFYLETATSALIPYYQGLGYEISEQSCDGQTALVATHEGQMMRLCNAAESSLVKGLPAYIKRASEELSAKLLISSSAKEEFYGS